MTTYGHALCRLAEKDHGPQRRYSVWGIGSNSNSQDCQRPRWRTVSEANAETAKNITLNKIVSLLAKYCSVQIVRSALSTWLLARCLSQPTHNISKLYALYKVLHRLPSNMRFIALTPPSNSLIGFGFENNQP